MKHDESYLESYNNENSEVIKSLHVNEKIIRRFLMFLITSIIYIIIKIISNTRKLNELQMQSLNSFINYIMYFACIIAVIGLFCFIGSLISVNFKNKLEQLTYSKKKHLFTFLDWSVILPVCAIIATFCFSFVFAFAEVDGSSMMPTIEDGNIVFVSYLEKIERFDVVVAYITEEDSIVSNSKKYPEYYIKRVIGLPGDTLTWINGHLVINDEEIYEYYFDEATIKEYQNSSLNQFKGLFQYKENGEIKSTYVIPEGYYFIMGDNRNNSTDSRMIGLVPASNIEGVVKYQVKNFIFYKEVK